VNHGEMESTKGAIEWDTGKPCFGVHQNIDQTDRRACRENGPLRATLTAKKRSSDINSSRSPIARRGPAILVGGSAFEGPHTGDFTAKLLLSPESTAHQHSRPKLPSRNSQYGLS
jgi:hypothetical protein